VLSDVRSLIYLVRSYKGHERRGVTSSCTLHRAPRDRRSLKILRRSAPASGTDDGLVCYGFRSQVGRTDTRDYLLCGQIGSFRTCRRGSRCMKGNRPAARN